MTIKRSSAGLGLHFALLVFVPVLTAPSGSAQAPASATIYSFRGGADGAGPTGGVTIGESGVLYGTTYVGGLSRAGTVFKLAPAGESWTESVLYSFTGGDDGAFPTSNLVFGTSQVLYGTTGEGGPGNGTVFKLTPSNTGLWTQTVLYDFAPGQFPFFGVLIGPEGTLYTPGDLGAVAVTPPTTPGGNWTGTVIDSSQTDPGAGFVSEGRALYGVSMNGNGSVYELEPPTVPGGSWVSTTIHDFVPAPTDGGGPLGLTVGPGGILYGTTFWGGTGTKCQIIGQYPYYGCGTVFQLTPPAAPGSVWTETVIYNFTGESGDGAFPSGPVVVGQNGELYGITEAGGSGGFGGIFGVTGWGTVFALTPPAVPGGAWTETILHSFTGVNGDGEEPIGVLALSSSGVLYGATSGGGYANLGTVFGVTP